jgi:hypothetical protein
MTATATDVPTTATNATTTERGRRLSRRWRNTALTAQPQWSRSPVSFRHCSDGRRVCPRSSRVAPALNHRARATLERVDRLELAA